MGRKVNIIALFVGVFAFITSVGRNPAVAVMLALLLGGGIFLVGNGMAGRLFREEFDEQPSE